MSTTTNKSLVEPAFNNTTGTLPDGTPYTSWDSPVNYNSTTIDNAFGSVAAISTAGITTTQTLTLAQYQPLIINFTGALTVGLIYNFPTGVGGHWIVRNSCTGAFSLSIGSNGSTIVIPAGVSYYVYVDTSTAPYISFLNISGFKTYAGNPNTFVAGNSTSPASAIWDTTNNGLWVCTTSGPASTAVWTAATTALLATANTWSNTNIYSSSTGALALTAGPIATPGGRLTLTSLTPVLTSDVTGATTIYYSPYLHNFIMLYIGTSWQTWGFSELSQTLADTTKSPAATVASNAYDVFFWNDSGTLRATRGPSWSAGSGGSTTVRGTGAGSTALVRVNGVLMNANAITNGPAAQRGIYIGSFITNASNTVDWVANPAAAAGGGNCRLNLWNMYNRVQVSATSKESTGTWVYTTATWRSANGSNANRISLFSGLNENIISITVSTYMIQTVGGVDVHCGIGVDVTNAASGLIGFLNMAGTSLAGTGISFYNALPGLGSHFFQWVEYSANQGTTTWYGDFSAPTNWQSAITAIVMM